MLTNVTRAYTDRLTGRIHLVGDEVELTEERLVELSGKGFVEPAGRPAEGAAPDFRAMTCEELRAIAAGRGIATRGLRKAELVAALEG